jgi:hypothetical protein
MNEEVDAAFLGRPNRLSGLEKGLRQLAILADIRALERDDKELPSRLCAPRHSASPPEVLFQRGRRRVEGCCVNRVSVSKCAQGGTDMIAPEWSERVSDRHVRNFWCCEACGYRCEDTVYFSSPGFGGTSMTGFRKYHGVRAALRLALWTSISNRNKKDGRETCYSSERFTSSPVVGF